MSYTNKETTFRYLENKWKFKIPTLIHILRFSFFLNIILTNKSKVSLKSVNHIALPHTQELV